MDVPEKKSSLLIGVFLVVVFTGMALLVITLPSVHTVQNTLEKSDADFKDNAEVPTDKVVGEPKSEKQ